MAACSLEVMQPGSRWNRWTRVPVLIQRLHLNQLAALEPAVGCTLRRISVRI
jgi:hypothetical protein